MKKVSGAILQRDGKTYGIMTNSPAGIVTPRDLEHMGGHPPVLQPVDEAVPPVGALPRDHETARAQRWRGIDDLADAPLAEHDPAGSGEFEPHGRLVSPPGIGREDVRKAGAVSRFGHHGLHREPPGQVVGRLLVPGSGLLGAVRLDEHEP